MGERALLGGRYDLGAAIGSGGFATVFRARDRRADVEVAVKLVPPGLGSELSAARLLDEAAVLKNLSSRFIARIYDVGEDAHGVWLVMELVSGVHLSPEALGRSLLPHEVMRVSRGLLEGLAAAHAVGIVHADVKPSNVLVPTTNDVLEAPKLIDFGLARVTTREDLARALGDPLPVSGVVLGTARYMAPEVLRGAAVDPRSDVYSVGVLLFELLGEGPLFAGESTREQLRARLAGDPDLAGRVPLPLSAVLGRMLARDPARRFRDAGEALLAVSDLDTAPVSPMSPMSVGDDAPPVSFRWASEDDRRSSIPPRGSPLPVTRAPDPRLTAPAGARSAMDRPFPPAKLTSLPADGVDALRETLRYLDLAMLDALARRDRASAIGQVARAVAFALRLELDAAALILEPLVLQSGVARAVGASVLAPRSRRATRGRVDTDRADEWVDTVPIELSGLLVALATALSTREDAPRDVERCARALERLEAPTADDMAMVRRVDTLRVTLRLAHTAARVRLGELAPGTALDLVKPLHAADPRAVAPFDRVVRAICLAATCVRLDESRARDELGRAVRVAAESGTILLEACAAVTLGRLLVETPTRVEQGLAVLERAATLLSQGDAPSLEHEAEHHCAAALVVQGRWADALPHLVRARAAAHAERAGELEVLSASLEVLARLALGDLEAAREAGSMLADARIGPVGGRAAALAWLARALLALASGEKQPAEDALAEARARAREADPESADVFVLVEILALLFDAARGAVDDPVAAASDLERFAEEHAFASFYWVDILRGVVDRVPDAETRAAMLDALSRLALLLGPSSRLARDRRTSAPPPVG